MRIIALISLGLLLSCRVGPKYTTPQAPIPPTYKESSTWKEAVPRDESLRGNWWEMFGDAELNALEEQVDISNQTIALAEAQFRSARAAVRLARSGLFPTLTVGAAATTSRTPVGSDRRFGSTGTGTFYTVPIDLAYEADFWGRIRNTVTAQVASTQASAGDLETARLSVHSELALDYFELRGLDELRRLFDATVAAYEQALQLSTNLYNQGVASALDVAQAQTQLDTARAQAIDLGVARAQFEHAIAILIGKPPAELTIPPAPIAVNPPEIPVGLPSELLERRPDIAAAERRVASANAQIGVARAAFFPSVVLTATGGFESSRIGNLLSWPSRFWSLGPSLAQTLFDAGRRSATVDEAKAAYDSTVAVYRQDVLTAFQDVEDNLAALRILSDEAAQQDIAVQSTQRSLDLATNRYRGGIASYLDVITAQNALLANQRSAIGIGIRRMTSSVLLIKGLGGGWNAASLPSSKTLTQ